MAIINTTKPTTLQWASWQIPWIDNDYATWNQLNATLLNRAKVGEAETWDTIPTTWASETRTWSECVSLFTNGTKVSSTITNTSKPA